MMNAHERDALASPPGILERVIPANPLAIAFLRPPRKEPADWRALGAATDAPDRTALPVDDKTLTETKPLAQSIRRWRGETASA